MDFRKWKENRAADFDRGRFFFPKNENEQIEGANPQLDRPAFFSSC
jgi:hypothetical protein